MCIVYMLDSFPGSFHISTTRNEEKQILKKILSFCVEFCYNSRKEYLLKGK